MEFHYKAIDKNSSVVTGVFTGQSEKSVSRNLREQGLKILSLKAMGVEGVARSKSGNKPNSKELLIVMRQLMTLLKAGLALEDVVSSVADFHQNAYLAQKFTIIRSSLRQGVAFSRALRDSALELPLYFYPLLESGELTGFLARSLHDGVKQWEEEQKLSSEMRQALTYPVILIVSGFVAVMLIFAVVVPKFSSLLTKGKVEIPFLARMVLGAGSFVHDNLLIVVLGMAAVCVGGIWLLRDKTQRARMQNHAATLPGIRTFLLESVLCQWAAMLSTLLANKVSLDKALEFSLKSISIEKFQLPMRQVVRGVRSGETLSESLLKTNLLSHTGYNLVRVGEKSGNLAEMLRGYADILVESQQDKTRRFLALMEPVAILVIGITIGVIMTGIILAITSVNDLAV